MGFKIQQSLSDRLIVEKALPDHAYHLSPRLCLADKEHLAAAYEHGDIIPEEALRQSIRESEQAFTITDEDGVIHGIWGHGSWDRPTGVGYVWLMCDDELFTTHLRELTRRFRREFIPILDFLYTAYGNSVMTKQNGLIRWLAAAGFRSKTRCDHTGEMFTLMMRGL